MSQIKELDKDVLRIFVLKETLTDDFDGNKYYISKFYADEITNDIIHMTVNFKSRESAREFTEINGQPVSMDFVIVKTFDIAFNEYNKFVRSKKINRIISSFDPISS